MGDFVVLMAKEPLLGLSKTRLAADVGPERARDLAEAFLLDTLALAAARPGTTTLVAYAPTDAWFRAHAQGAALTPQVEGDLGARMEAAVRDAQSLGAERCVLLGMDTPHLSPEVLDAAFQGLDSVDLTLAPAADGGYVLLGLRAVHRELFRHMPWSTDQVAGLTLDRAIAAGLGVRVLEGQFDVDDALGLTLLRRHLLGNPGLAPWSRQLLD